MSADEISKWIVIVFILCGAIFCLLSAIGLIRFPDVYTRSHAATKSATLGVLCIMSGTALYFFLFKGHFSAQLVLAIIFVFITAPVGGHLITRAAYRTKVKLSDKSVQDDLRAALNENDYRQEDGSPQEAEPS